MQTKFEGTRNESTFLSLKINTGKIIRRQFLHFHPISGTKLNLTRTREKKIQYHVKKFSPCVDISFCHRLKKKERRGKERCISCILVCFCSFCTKRPLLLYKNCYIFKRKKWIYEHINNRYKMPKIKQNE